MQKNEPFKKRLSELLDRYTLTFLWDLLHLANRAHMAARGSTEYEKEEAPKKVNDSTISEEDVDDIVIDQYSDPTTVSELINYIQCNAKTN